VLHLVIPIPERLHLPLLALLAAVLFSVNLGGYDLWPADEPRYAQVAREMLDSGNWLSPTVNGESYLEKPPLLFWSQALVSLPFGDINECTARVPSALSGIVVLVLTYLLARGLFGAQTAFYAALFLLTCHQ
jgi:4-amino-4-deoxy-L-arabinose transferase-like glycosyltransferase